MTRLARVAVSAVLAALSVGMQASAASLAHLDPQRVFDPQSGSFLEEFFAPPAAAAYTYVDASIFHVAASQPAGWQSIGESAPASGVADVNFRMPRVRASFSPQRISVSYDSLPNVEAESQPATQEEVAPQAVRLQTAAPVLEAPQPPPVHFGTYTPYIPSASLTEGTSVPVRIGPVHFQTAFHAMEVCGTTDAAAACSSLANTQALQSMSAGTNFDVRAGSRNVSVQISSNLEHLSNQSAGVFPYVPVDPDAQAGLSYAGLTDVVEHGLGAGLAIPITRRVSVGLQYDYSHYQGDYDTTAIPGFEAYKNTYLGNVTYQMPNTSSAITLSARQYRYQDLFAPNFSLTQTRADLDFTVKF
jgi:hypothetical protein